MSRLSPVGSMRGPCQLAQPATTATHPIKAAARRIVRLVAWWDIQHWPSVPARQKLFANQLWMIEQEETEGTEKYSTRRSEWNLRPRMLVSFSASSASACTNESVCKNDYAAEPDTDSAAQSTSLLKPTAWRSWCCGNATRLLRFFNRRRGVVPAMRRTRPISNGRHALWRDARSAFDKPPCCQKLPRNAPETHCDP
jgi:hypothetical protein